MFASYRPILSLLRGTAFLLAASGLHGLLLPLRGQAEGFTTATLGLLGTAWAAGFVAGCFFAPRLVRRVGHVRAFGAFAASGEFDHCRLQFWRRDSRRIPTLPHRRSAVRRLTSFNVRQSATGVRSCRLDAPEKPD